VSSSRKDSFNHAVQHRQELVDVLLSAHDFNDQRQVHREPEDFRRVQTAGFAEAHRPAQRRRAGQVQFVRFEHDGLVKRMVMPSVALADKNAQQDGFVRDLHIRVLSMN
jgi:hypothetical protein